MSNRRRRTAGSRCKVAEESTDHRLRRLSLVVERGTVPSTVRTPRSPQLQCNDVIIELNYVPEKPRDAPLCCFKT